MVALAASHPMNDFDLKAALDSLIRRALSEDLGIDVSPETTPGSLVARDVTTRTAVPAGVRGRATLVAKQGGVLAGGLAFERAMSMLDATSTVEALIADGQEIAPGDIVLHASGDARALLIAERTALNIVQRMSGVATRTREAVDLVEGLPVRILDTRKTTPGMRALDKYAVRVGGGENHRTGLFDEAMVKENHVDLAGRSIEAVLADLRSDLGPEFMITCEARDRAEAEAAVRGGADNVLLDNMTPDEMAAIAPGLRRLAQDRGRPLELEASGGIDSDTLRAAANSGVDRISMGALTHSAPALDLSIELQVDSASAPGSRRSVSAEVVRRDDEHGALDLDLPATHAHGRMARRIARQFCETEGLDGDECNTLEFVVGELLDNAVDHGGGGAARQLEDLVHDVRMRLVVRVDVGGESTRWSVRVEDQGGGEPAAVRAMIAPEDGIPDLEDERGRGFFLLAQMVDALDVSTSGDGLGLSLEARRSLDGRAAG